MCRWPAMAAGGGNKPGHRQLASNETTLALGYCPPPAVMKTGGKGEGGGGRRLYRECGEEGEGNIVSEIGHIYMHEQ